MHGDSQIITKKYLWRVIIACLKGTEYLKKEKEAVESHDHLCPEGTQQ